MGFLNTQPAPLTDDGGGDPFADFRCEHPREVQALLRELRNLTEPWLPEIERIIAGKPRILH